MPSTTATSAAAPNDGRDPPLPTDEEFASEITAVYSENFPTLVPPKSPSSPNRAADLERWKMARDEALLERLLDSATVDGGMNEEGKQEMTTFLQTDNAYEALADCIVSPSSDCGGGGDYEAFIKRSYRAMTILANDAAVAANIQRRGGNLEEVGPNYDLVLNPTRAGLLAKKLFAAYGDAAARPSEEEGKDGSAEVHDRRLRPHVPHVNHLLQSLLEGYPSAVVSAACAGGKDGIKSNFGPMLALANGAEHEAAASPLPIVTTLVVSGCAGRSGLERGGATAAQQQQQQQMGGPAVANQGDVVPISKGHRRKFVRSLSDYGLLLEIVKCITSGITSGGSTDESLIESDASALLHSEGACDSLLTIVDCIGYPPPPSSMGASATAKPSVDESVGEEAILSPLGGKELIQTLVKCSADRNNLRASSASRALLGMFELATGRSKKKSAPPVEDATDENEVEAQAAKTVKDNNAEAALMNNKLLKVGLTAKMHANIVSNVDLIVGGIENGPSIEQTKEGDSTERSSDAGPVRHPGRCIIARPFTTRRLNLITLLADIISYEEDDLPDEESKERLDRYELALSAMDALMALPLPPSLLKKKKKGSQEEEPSQNDNEADSRGPENPWPLLCDLLFEYPENNMYHIQFYRLLYAACMANHEPTLKLVVQQCKFVARAIRICGADSTASKGHQGVLLRCLNALRLHSQSLPPSSFLRHYLDSHDGWKAFHETLQRVTIEQQRPGGGIDVPQINGETTVVRTVTPDAVSDIDLGSAFALELGFKASIHKYVEGEESSSVKSAPSPDALSSTQKDKKKTKKKKKKKK